MATKTFTNFADLLAHVQDGIQDSLEHGVADVVKQEISDTARTNVMLQGAGRETDGIDDLNNMEAEVTGGPKVFKLKVKDVAKPQPSVFNQPFDNTKDAAVGGTMFANWIEHGEWVDLRAMLNHRIAIGWNPGAGEKWSDFKARGLPMSELSYKLKREPRPFIEPTQQYFEQNSDAILKEIEKSILK